VWRDFEGGDNGVWRRLGYWVQGFTAGAQGPAFISERADGQKRTRGSGRLDRLVGEFAVKSHLGRQPSSPRSPDGKRSPPPPPPATPLPVRASSAPPPFLLAPPGLPFSRGMATASPPGKGEITSLRLGCRRVTCFSRTAWRSPSLITRRLSPTFRPSSTPLSSLCVPTSASNSSHLLEGSNSCGSPTTQTGSGCGRSTLSVLGVVPHPGASRGDL
jgi:hypothetical protein